MADTREHDAARGSVGVAGRLAAFAMVLAVSFGGAYAVGAAVGPIGSAPTGTAPAEPSPHGGGHGG